MISQRRFKANSFKLITGLGITLLVSSVNAYQIDISNTLKLEDYDSGGDITQSPYAFDGGQYFNEFDFNVSHELSPYDQWRAQFFGVINDSVYRSIHDDLVPERINIVREKGDTSIPFRVEAGDFLGYFSYLTHQMPLKGLRLDLQPNSKSNRYADSFQIFFGDAENEWRDTDFGDDQLAGLSWLREHESWGTYGLNFVHSMRDEEIVGVDIDQSVVSLVWQNEFQLSSADLNAQVEFAHLDGDVLLSDGVTVVDESDQGITAKFDATLKNYPLRFELYLEDYGEFYIPRGAVVPADRQSQELFAFWKAGSGLNIKARAQHFEDNAESANPLDTVTTGVNFSGGLLSAWLKNANGSVDVYYQTVDDMVGTQDQETLVFDANLGFSLVDKWNGNVGVFVRDMKDNLLSSNDQVTRQLSLSASYQYSGDYFNATVTPGILYRQLSGLVDRDEIKPTLSVAAFNKQHRLGFHYGYLQQDEEIAGASDFDVQTIKLDYQYTRGRNTFGVEYERFDRSVDAAQDTDAHALSAYWTWRFSKRAQSGLSQSFSAGNQYVTSADISSLTPGANLGQVIQVLEAAGFNYPNTPGNTLVFEQPVIDQIDLRQRLVIEHAYDRLTKSTLIIDFDDLRDSAAMQRQYLDVQKQLISQYGNPDTAYESGDFSGSSFRKINNGDLVRVMEWQTSRGVMRFGIPKRYDGKVRMELQHDETFPAISEPSWSWLTF